MAGYKFEGSDVTGNKMNLRLRVGRWKVGCVAVDTLSKMLVLYFCKKCTR